jgi:four helix bundle protein
MTTETPIYDFEKLHVYQHSLEFYSGIRAIKLDQSSTDRIIQNQLVRAGLSVSLNIAEGAGRTGDLDKRKFYTIARASAYECVAVLNILKMSGDIEPSDHDRLYRLSHTICRMLSTMINNFEEKAAKKKGKR